MADDLDDILYGNLDEAPLIDSLVNEPMTPITKIDKEVPVTLNKDVNAMSSIAVAPDSYNESDLQFQAIETLTDYEQGQIITHEGEGLEGQDGTSAAKAILLDPNISAQG